MTVCRRAMIHFQRFSSSLKVEGEVMERSRSAEQKRHYDVLSHYALHPSAGDRKGRAISRVDSLAEAQSFRRHLSEEGRASCIVDFLTDAMVEGDEAVYRDFFRAPAESAVSERGQAP